MSSLGITLTDRFGRSFEILFSRQNTATQPIALGDPALARQQLLAFDLSMAQWRLMLSRSQLLIPHTAWQSEATLLGFLANALAAGLIRLYPKEAVVSTVQTYSDGVWVYRFCDTKTATKVSGDDKVTISSAEDAGALLKKIKGGEKHFESILQQTGFADRVKSGDAAANRATLQELMVDQKVLVHRVSRIATNKPDAPGELPPLGPGNRPVPLTGNNKTDRVNWFCIKLKDQDGNLVKSGAMEVKLTDGNESKVTINGGYHKTGSTLPPGNCELKAMELGDDSEVYVFESVATE